MICKQFEDLQEAYLQRRRHAVRMQQQKWVQESSQKKLKEEKLPAPQNYCVGLDDFQSVLTAFTRYRCLIDSNVSPHFLLSVDF
jgi:E3 ubiquitin-protein ligase RFWD2